MRLKQCLLLASSDFSPSSFLCGPDSSTTCSRNLALGLCLAAFGSSPTCSLSSGDLRTSGSRHCFATCSCPGSCIARQWIDGRDCFVQAVTFLLQFIKDNLQICHARDCSTSLRLKVWPRLQLIAKHLARRPHLNSQHGCMQPNFAQFHTFIYIFTENSSRKGLPLEWVELEASLEDLSR